MDAEQAAMREALSPSGGNGNNDSGHTAVEVGADELANLRQQIA